MKTGLVLEGGGLRGIFSAGVLDVLMEEGITFDGIVGVSAGAAFGSNYKSGQNRRAIRYNLRFAKDPRYSSIMSLIATGNLFNAQFCYHDIPEKLDPFDWEAFQENPAEFYLVCTDADTGKPVYHKCDREDRYEMLEWFRASGSMPLVSRPVEIEGKRLLDGGISDSIPLRFMEDQGYERNLVILTQPADYKKQPVSMVSFIRAGLRTYPAAAEAIEKRHNMYNEELAYIRQREAGGYAFVVRPAQALDIGRVEHDRIKIRAAYKAGRVMARRLLPEILRFMENAKKAPSEVKPSLIEKEAKADGIVRPSLVEDPSLIPVREKDGTKETAPDRAAAGLPEAAGAGTYEKTPGSDPFPSQGFALVGEDFPSRGSAPAGEEEPEKERPFTESRSVLIQEPAEDIPAFQRPFPMDREKDQPPAREYAGREPETGKRQGESTAFPSSKKRNGKRKHKKAWKPDDMAALKAPAAQAEMSAAEPGNQAKSDGESHSGE